MSQAESVTCIIPAWNAEGYIVEALTSALTQTRPPDEIVVIDDGSTDDTAARVRSIGDSRIRYVHQTNAGATRARNHGLQLAEGSFIAMLDADDLWLPEKTERQLERFRSQPELDACTTLMQNFWEEALAAEADANPQLVAPQPGVLSTAMFRRSAFERIGMLDERFPDRDLQDWLMRLRQSGGHHVLLDRVLVRRRVHADNMSRTRPPGEDQLLDLAMRLIARKRNRPAD